MELVRRCDTVLAMNAKDVALAVATRGHDRDVVRIVPASHPGKGRDRGRFGLPRAHRHGGDVILWAGAWLRAKGPLNLSRRFAELRRTRPDLDVKLVMFGGYGDGLPDPELPDPHPDIVCVDGNAADLPDALAQMRVRGVQLATASGRLPRKPADPGRGDDEWEDLRGPVRHADAQRDRPSRQSRGHRCGVGTRRRATTRRRPPPRVAGAPLPRRPPAYVQPREHDRRGRAGDQNSARNSPRIRAVTPGPPRSLHFSTQLWAGGERSRSGVPVGRGVPLCRPTRPNPFAL
jgi:hypothetical protein